jgi:hypothetical protein
MRTRNLTLAIDEELLERARILAVRRRTSLTKMVRAHLMAVVDEDQRFEGARQRLLACMIEAPLSVGERSWTREELHER